MKIKEAVSAIKFMVKNSIKLDDLKVDYVSGRVFTEYESMARDVGFHSSEFSVIESLNTGTTIFIFSIFGKLIAMSEMFYFDSEIRDGAYSTKDIINVKALEDAHATKFIIRTRDMNFIRSGTVDQYRGDLIMSNTFIQKGGPIVLQSMSISI